MRFPAILYIHVYVLRDIICVIEQSIEIRLTFFISLFYYSKRIDMNISKNKLQAVW